MRFFQAVTSIIGKLGSIIFFNAARARRASLKTERLESQISEAERLDRLRNPSDYRGR
jgi:hypothetical protein